VNPFELVFGGVQPLVAEALEVDQLIACTRGAADELIELELQHTRVSILGVLNEEGDTHPRYRVHEGKDMNQFRRIADATASAVGSPGAFTATVAATAIWLGLVPAVCATEGLASDRERPRWNAGDFFGERFGRKR